MLSRIVALDEVSRSLLDCEARHDDHKLEQSELTVQFEHRTRIDIGLARPGLHLDVDEVLIVASALDQRISVSRNVWTGFRQRRHGGRYGVQRLPLVPQLFQMDFHLNTASQSTHHRSVIASR